MAQTCLAELKSVVLPALFQNPSTIGEYGRSETGTNTMAELSELMEGAPVSRLASSIGEIVTTLSDADPKKIAKPPTWLDRFLGKPVETHVRYQLARRELDALLEEAEGTAQGVRDAIGAIDRLLIAHQMEVEQLEAYVKAGEEYLAENPEVGKPGAGEIAFDNPRERFARKLANLRTLLASHGMSVTQMQLTKAQAVDMLDRFEETARMLVPVWRQHTLALTTTKHMSPGMVAEATKAHDALMRSLAQSMKSIER